ncbi:putative NADH-flavin reductase [Bacillus ectoiniformans]|uniref:NAD(P)-dependent oxidoreductase n=1 Tax=Bacillus ectoiniformans TaxID=1494429 RepID=UPI00195C80D7|nr:NAD(P)H-binding protein [Bacillus ectoiniformans]MBM7647633.1 putative NADH-flavin reductase [Bacillus ectoiniformans]
MNICLFGATGRVGSSILQRLLKADHQVTCLVRSPQKMAYSHPNLTLIQGDATSDYYVMEAMDSAEAVMVALGSDGTNTISQSMPLILKSMRKKQIKRLITISTAGILQSRIEPAKYRFQTSESKRKSTKAAEDHLKAYLMIRQSEMVWTIICPTYLPLGEERGHYRLEKEHLPLNGKEITTEDTAAFACEQLVDEEYIQTRVGICY